MIISVNYYVVLRSRCECFKPIVFLSFLVSGLLIMFFEFHYQARKALRALKGIVKLQAYIRGRAVRRQAMTTLKCLQSVVNIQSQVCGKRTQIPRGSHRDYEESNTGHMFSENILKVGNLIFKI